MIASGEDRATALARRHSFDVGDPISFDQEESRVTSLEYVLGALGADVINGFRALAKKRRLKLNEVEAQIDVELNNPLIYLGVVGEQGHPGIERIRVKVYISTQAMENEVAVVWSEMLEKSPLVCTLRSVIELRLDYKLVL